VHVRATLRVGNMTYCEILRSSRKLRGGLRQSRRASVSIASLKHQHTRSRGARLAAATRLSVSTTTALAVRVFVTRKWRNDVFVVSACTSASNAAVPDALDSRPGAAETHSRRACQRARARQHRRCC
jgi:hypothetical protein